jgi:hypothetical protein
MRALDVVSTAVHASTGSARAEEFIRTSPAMPMATHASRFPPNSR